MDYNFIRVGKKSVFNYILGGNVLGVWLFVGMDVGEGEGWLGCWYVTYTSSDLILVELGLRCFALGFF